MGETTSAHSYLFFPSFVEHPFVVRQEPTCHFHASFAIQQQTWSPRVEMVELQGRSSQDPRIAWKQKVSANKHQNAREQRKEKRRRAEPLIFQVLSIASASSLNWLTHTCFWFWAYLNTVLTKVYILVKNSKSANQSQCSPLSSSSKM